MKPKSSFNACRRSGSLAAATAALAVVLSGCTAAAPASEGSAGAAAEEITLVSSITGSSFLAVTAGLDQGIFVKHGVDVNVVKVKSSAEAAAGIASGQADLAAMLPEGVLAVAAAGGNMKMVGNLLNQIQYRLESVPQVQTSEDLVGQKIGIVGPGSGEEVLAKAYLTKNGIDPADVTFVATGPQSSKFAALATGQVQGAMLVPPFDIKAEAQGMHPLGILREDFPDVPAQVYVSSVDSLQARPIAVKAFLAAAAESAQWVVNHPEEAVEILAEDAQISTEDAQNSFDRARDAYSLNGAISDSGLEEWLELSEKYGAIRDTPPASELYDNQYLPSS